MSSEPRTARETLEQLINRAEVMLMSRSYPPNAGNLAADLDERTQLGYDLVAALRATTAPIEHRKCQDCGHVTTGEHHVCLAPARIREWAIYCFTKHGDDAKLYNGLAKLAGMTPESLGAAPAPTEPLPDEFEADGVNYCGHCYQAIEQTPSEQLAAALSAAPAPEGETPPHEYVTFIGHLAGRCSVCGLTLENGHHVSPAPTPESVDVWATDGLGRSFKTGETVSIPQPAPTPEGRETMEQRVDRTIDWMVKAQPEIEAIKREAKAETLREMITAAEQEDSAFVVAGILRSELAALTGGTKGA